jgi:hypothetical protein
MSDTGTREWRFYLDDMIDFAVFSSHGAHRRVFKNRHPLSGNDIPPGPGQYWIICSDNISDRSIYLKVYPRSVFNRSAIFVPAFVKSK